MPTAASMKVCGPSGCATAKANVATATGVPIPGCGNDQSRQKSMQLDLQAFVLLSAGRTIAETGKLITGAALVLWWRQTETDMTVSGSTISGKVVERRCGCSCKWQSHIQS
eukprot:SAG31_NODE_1565_length_7868_cov_27.758914_5_plen_111_part_00